MTRLLLMSHKIDRCVEEFLALDRVIVSRKFGFKATEKYVICF